MKKEIKEGVSNIIGSSIACALGLTGGVAGMFAGIIVGEGISLIIKHLLNYFEMKNLSKQQKINLAFVIEQVKIDDDSTPAIIDHDWLNCYFECAKKAESSTLRLMWSYVLTNQINNHNIHKSSLETFNQLSEEDFCLFGKLVDFIVETKEEKLIPQLEFIFKKIGYTSFLDLSEVGLINPNFELKMDHCATPEIKTLCSNFKYVVSYQTDINEKRFFFKTFRLTRAGRDLLTIYEPYKGIEVIQELVLFLELNFEDINFKIYEFTEKSEQGYKLKN